MSDEPTYIRGMWYALEYALRYLLCGVILLLMALVLVWTYHQVHPYAAFAIVGAFILWAVLREPIADWLWLRQIKRENAQRQMEERIVQKVLSRMQRR